MKDKPFRTKKTLVKTKVSQETCVLNVHSVESFGTFDGPGIRFVVFLQGCPLRCLYCANPDTMRFNQGENRTIDSLFDEAMRMKSYFSSGGGVTASGGEPCCQAKNLIPFFRKLKENGINTALDTNGSVINRFVPELLELTDLVLLDVKQMDASMHEILTGKTNDKVLSFAEYLKEIGKPTWLRYVLVPGLTDKPAHMHQLGEYFQHHQNIEKLEIQPYHKLGAHKWKLLDQKYPLEGVPENTPQQLAIAKEIFTPYFKEVVVN